jgi:hypothetical protein
MGARASRASAVATTTAIAPLGGDAGQPFAPLPQIPSYADEGDDVDALIADNAGNTISEDDPVVSGAQQVADRYNQLSASYGDAAELTAASYAITEEDRTGTIIDLTGTAPSEIQEDDSLASTALSISPLTNDDFSGPSLDAGSLIQDGADLSINIGSGGIFSNLFGPTDYVAAGLAITSGGHAALIDAQKIESSFFKIGAVPVKYGLPAVLADVPAGVGAAIGVGQAYQAYKAGETGEAGEKLSGSFGGVLGGLAGELAVAAYVGAAGGAALLVEGSAAAIAAGFALPIIGGIVLGAGFVIGYRAISGYRPPLPNH